MRFFLESFAWIQMKYLDTNLNKVLGISRQEHFMVGRVSPVLFTRYNLFFETILKEFFGKPTLWSFVGCCKASVNLVRPLGWCGHSQAVSFPPKSRNNMFYTQAQFFRTIFATTFPKPNVKKKKKCRKPLKHAKSTRNYLFSICTWSSYESLLQFEFYWDSSNNTFIPAYSVHLIDTKKRLSIWSIYGWQ